MGWSSGSEIMNAVIEAVRDEVKNKERRKAIYKPVIEILENGDWDTQDESIGLDQAFDELLLESPWGEAYKELIDIMREEGTLQYEWED